MTEWPATNIEARAVTALIPYEKNARTHSPEQITQLVESIRQWGWTNPILVDEADTIIAGHGRVLAAKQLELTQVPVIVARGWSEAQKRAYVLADNQLALNAGWDLKMLKGELQGLKEWDFDLGLLGFDNLDALMADQTEGLTDPDAPAPPKPEWPASRPGDLWTLGRHRLLCGDATCEADVVNLLDGVEPHLMITDPPYGVDYDPAWRARAKVNLNPGKQGRVVNDERDDWREAWELFPGDVAYVWHASQHVMAAVDSLEACGFTLRAQIIWAKDRFALGRGDYHWQHEPCLYAVRRKMTGHWCGGRSQSTLWSIPARDDSGHGHGTQKPVECMRRPMENNSSPGQAVYDPFVGSGTTIIAAEMTGRQCFALEIDPGYCDVVIERWQAFTGKTAMLGKREFHSVKMARNKKEAPAEKAGAEVAG